MVTAGPIPESLSKPSTSYPMMRNMRQDSSLAKSFISYPKDMESSLRQNFSSDSFRGKSLREDRRARHFCQVSMERAANPYTGCSNLARP